MRIAIVVGGLPFGGIENLVYDVGCELERRKVDFKIVNISGTGEKLNEFFEKKLPVVNLFNNKKVLKTHKISTAKKLRQWLDLYKPDIVHSMHFSADYFSRIASIGRNWKVITHIHNIKLEKRWERKVANKILSYRTDLFLSVSNDVYEMVQKRHNLAKRPNMVLYNAINTKKFKGIDFSKKEDVIVCVGRLFKQKNYDIAIRAFSLIRDEFPSYRLWIVGNGKERDNLERLSRQLSLGEYVKFLGYRRDIPNIVAKSKIMLVPSSYEGFSIAYLEAMYAGVVGVISPFVPIKEIASECSMIAPIDENAIADALRKLIIDKELFKQLSKRAKEIAKDYAIETYVDKLLAIYKKVLGNKVG